jgi:hypothetical protein
MMLNGKRNRKPVEDEEDDGEEVMSRDQTDDLFGVASATRSHRQNGQAQSKARPLVDDSGMLAVAGVGSSRDGDRANATVVAEAARAQLLRNEKLRQLVGSYVDSFHGTGSIHVRELLSDEYSLMVLLARHLKWREMDGTVEASLPTHGKFKARTIKPVAGLVGVICELVSSMVLLARDGCVANMQDVLADKDRRQADGGRVPGGGVNHAAVGGALGVTVPGVKIYKAAYLGHYMDEGRVARLSSVEGGDGARRETSMEQIETVHEEVTVAQGNSKQGESQLTTPTTLTTPTPEVDGSDGLLINELACSTRASLKRKQVDSNERGPITGSC